MPSAKDVVAIHDLVLAEEGGLWGDHGIGGVEGALARVVNHTDYAGNEAIALLETGQVDEPSLDHDLGDDQRGTGYDVVLWIEEAVAPRCRSHTMGARRLPRTASHHGRASQAS